MSARAVFATIVILIALTVAIVAVVIVSGAYNFAADAPHTAIVKTVVAFARERSIDVRAEGIKVPPLNDPKMIGEGAEHYAEMCVACDLAPGVAENELRRGLNPKPPVLASIAPEEPAEWFWIVKHGLKMTAMPAWGITHSDAEIWNIVAFLQKLPRLSPQQYRALTQGSHQRHHMAG
jgi:mono/diheme cytochrome c family protein